MEMAGQVPGQVYVGRDFIPSQELNDRLQACDILLSWEGRDIPDTSGAAREMVAAYRPVVLSESTHFREIYENNLGINCGSKSIADLINKALELIEDPPQINPDSLEPFFYRNIAKKHLELYS